MIKLYFIVMRLFSKNPCSRIYNWAYMKCMKTYMTKDPIFGYWNFAKDYFRSGV